ncbi:MAG TPA: transposase, partial [Anaerolineae bacterium]|nr:transposase [Anaerolineae bacterium]
KRARKEGKKMLTYEKLKKKPSRFLALTSLRVEEFDELLPSFETAWGADVERRSQAQPRQRKPGGGRKPTLKSLADKLLFILVYFKTYPLQEVQGSLFGMSQGQANDWIQRLTPILQATLQVEAVLPEREPAKLEQVLADYDLLEFTIDGTQRRRQRPKDNVEQKAYYSGKKSPYRDQ